MLTLQATVGSLPFSLRFRAPFWRVVSLAEVWQDVWLKEPPWCTENLWLDRLLPGGNVLLFPEGEIQVLPRHRYTVSFDVTARGVMYMTRIHGNTRTQVNTIRFQFLTKDSEVELHRHGQMIAQFCAAGSLDLTSAIRSTALIRVLPGDVFKLKKRFGLVCLPESDIGLKRVRE